MKNYKLIKFHFYHPETQTFIALKFKKPIRYKNRFNRRLRKTVKWASRWASRLNKETDTE